MQACKYASTQVCKYASKHLSKYVGIQVCTYARLKYANMQVCKYANMQVCKNARMLFASCYLWLAICYLLTESFFLKLAITCKNLFPFAPVVRLVIFFFIWPQNSICLFFLPYMRDVWGCHSSNTPSNKFTKFEDKILNLQKSWSNLFKILFSYCLSILGNCFMNKMTALCTMLSYG